MIKLKGVNDAKSKSSAGGGAFSCVGIIMPIYNTPLHYLKEAINSVLSQTYEDFVLLLVNDGSTKVDVLEFCKEQVLKDARIVLVHKIQTEGASISRNIGIEYFSGKYCLKEYTREQNLYAFNVFAHNSYKITHIYQQHQKIPVISHLIFLDSDDVWNSNLLEECLKVAKKGIDIVWFADDKIVEDTDSAFDWTLQSIFHYENPQIITPKQWLERAKELQINQFWFAWQGMINFAFLRRINLAFIPRIMHEDIYFGILLFFLAKKIYVLPKKLTNYRIRKGSVTSFSGSVHLEQIAFFLRGAFKDFNEDLILTKNFYKSLSYMVTYFHLKQFIQEHQKSPNIKLLEQTFMPYYAQRYLDFIYFLNGYCSKEIDVNAYFEFSLRMVFNTLEGMFTQTPFENLDTHKDDQVRARYVHFVKGLLFLEDAHITRLLKEKQTLEQQLAQAQEIIKVLRSKLT